MNYTTTDFATLLPYKRINICGCPGAGKSTLADKISSATNIPVYDLDKLFYTDNCKRKSKADTSQSLSKILSKESFIIDGTYLTSFEERMNQIDLIVLVESKTLTCLKRFFWRMLTAKELKCGERLTRKTFNLILSFNSEARNKIVQVCKQHDKKFFLFKTTNL